MAIVDSKNKAGKVIAHELMVKLTDAGDAVPGAKIKGKTAKTNGKGIAKLGLPGSLNGRVTLTIYRSWLPHAEGQAKL